MPADSSSVHAAKAAISSQGTAIVCSVQNATIHRPKSSSTTDMPSTTTMLSKKLCNKVFLMNPRSSFAWASA
jgi:hypothetical protein